MCVRVTDYNARFVDCVAQKNRGLLILDVRQSDLGCGCDGTVSAAVLHIYLAFRSMEDLR